MRIEGLTKERFAEMLEQMVYECVIRHGEERAQLYTNLMDTARSYGLETELEKMAKAVCAKEDEPDLWELPKPFENECSLPKLTERCMPPKLWDYLRAVAEYVQVAPEMGVLPLLSVLSMCVQGKAAVKHPMNAHTEPLNLYTMTIAAPGERKSGCFREFVRPASEYQREKNKSLERAIRDYSTQKTYLENQRDKALKGKGDINEARKLDSQLAALKEIHPLKLTVTDVTAEALAGEMKKQGEKIAILDDEGTVFDVLAGIYSNGQANLNIMLKSYDGSPCTISRKTSGDISLYGPLLTVGLMVQPAHFGEAMSNRQFSGRGFIHRFLFAFPEARAGKLNFNSPDIPPKLKREYDDLVKGLLVLPDAEDEPPVLCFDETAALLCENYHDHIQHLIQQAGNSDDVREWANKQFARMMRIAAVFHLTEHGMKGKIDAQTVVWAQELALWSEKHALCALSGEGSESDTVRNAKLILEKLRKLGVDEITKSELLSKKLSRLSAKELFYPLELLENLNYIKVTEKKQDGTGRPKVTIKINPNIFL